MVAGGWDEDVRGGGGDEGDDCYLTCLQGF